MKRALALLTVAFALAVLLSFCALAIGCGGNGDDTEQPTKGEDMHGEPPCKSIPIEQRERECGT